MYDHNQTFVPDSFLALFAKHGRPTVARDELETRYETCENLALHVAELCTARQLDPDEYAAALRHCFDGLVAPPLSTSHAEAVWVVRRVAEILEWPTPAWLVEAAGPGHAT